MSEAEQALAVVIDLAGFVPAADQLLKALDQKALAPVTSPRVEWVWVRAFVQVQQPSVAEAVRLRQHLFGRQTAAGNCQHQTRGHQQMLTWPCQTASPHPPYTAKTKSFLT